MMFLILFYVVVTWKVLVGTVITLSGCLNVDMLQRSFQPWFYIPGMQQQLLGSQLLR
jgi:hypothetical protein